MRQAKSGDSLRVHYRGTLEDGTEFDSSAGGAPLEVTLGRSQVIVGFEQALMGMAEGDSKTVTLEPEAAYGPHNPELLHTVERSRIPAEIELESGTVLEASDSSGNSVRLTVVEVSEETVTLDANHMLAGKALTFELSLVEFVG